MIYQKLLNEVINNHFFDQHNKVLIALSGGVDSMNLLHFLSLYQKDLGISLGIAHINHKQRPESDIEENYLRNFAEAQGYPFYHMNFSGIFSEKAARDFRYDFFEKIMFEESYTALVTAHHADDQAETMLLKLLRGSRLRHLTGIKAVQDFGPGQLIRPFLTIKKSELPDIFHFEDSSNQSLNYFRNRVRHDYLPQLEKENPQFSKYLTELARENQIFQVALVELTSKMDVTDLKFFKSQSSALKEVLLGNYLEEFPKLQLSKIQFTHLLTLLENDNTYQIPLKNGHELVKNEKKFYIQKISPRTDSTLIPKVLKFQETLIFQGYRFTFLETGEGIELPSKSPIFLRGRKPQDKIDFGSFSKKLRRLFIDEKIPKKERTKAIIGEQEGQIIFVQTANNLYLRKFAENGTMKATLGIQKL
ncbi:tRNA lysidine(34) synthetase TilS [Streptococcus sp. S784/96/1]|uniref:tRNA lysidine(34) synthetase TilS n=1 Tax=Streptococcus sp. S784/96/1 TaxID=2653499 RepID=UPI001386A0B5|nr:tRNA lysidine(34) synthetase TilS [Streptococcus sp. S784/96/1]